MTAGADREPYGVGVPAPHPVRNIVLVTGASGYIGGRLADGLRERSVAVRVAGRRPEVLRERWPGSDAVLIDLLRPETLRSTLDGVRVAYYLVHSMSEGEAGFQERDRRAARNFAGAALASGVELVVYLGGLGDENERLSSHLESRHETGSVLAENGPPLLEFRAGMVIGGGSASFRMLHDLVRRLPAMVAPRWVQTSSQPIAIDDALAYLSAALRFAPDRRHTVVEIGGADVLSYEEMMQRVARTRGRRLVIVPVPVLTPRLSSLWCALVTAVPVSIARPLVDGLLNETIVRDDVATRLFPQIVPMGFDEAVRHALREPARATTE